MQVSGSLPTNRRVRPMDNVGGALPAQPSGVDGGAMAFNGAMGMPMLHRIMARMQGAPQPTPQQNQNGALPPQPTPAAAAGGPQPQTSLMPQGAGALPQAPPPAIAMANPQGTGGQPNPVQAMQLNPKSGGTAMERMQSLQNLLSSNRQTQPVLQPTRATFSSSPSMTPGMLAAMGESTDPSSVAGGKGKFDPLRSVFDPGGAGGAYFGGPDIFGGTFNHLFGRNNSSPLMDIQRALDAGQTISDASWAQAGYGPGGAALPRAA